MASLLIWPSVADASPSSSLDLPAAAAVAARDAKIEELQEEVEELHAALGHARRLGGGGGTTLWSMGMNFETNLVCVLFFVCIILALVLEKLHHFAENAPDAYKPAIHKVASELMIMGVISFAIVLVMSTSEAVSHAQLLNFEVRERARRPSADAPPGRAAAPPRQRENPPPLPTPPSSPTSSSSSRRSSSLSTP